MKLKYLLAALLFLSLSKSHADISDISEKVFGNLFGKSPCDDSPKHLPEMNVDEMMTMAVKAEQKRKFCDAARVYSEIRRQYPIKPYYKESWYRLIVSYLMAEDYVMAINEANGFMDFMIGAPELEDVHFLLLEAVYKKMLEAGPTRSQEYSEYALGISQYQNDNNPYFLNLTFNSYLEKYPQGKYIKAIEGWKKDARNQIAESNLQIAQYYYMRGQYVAAIMRYSVVLKFGIVTDIFPQAMFETIRTMAEFSEAIKSMSEEELADNMKKPKETVLDRDLISKQTLEQAKAILKQMQEALPNSEWTKKAIEYMVGK